MEKGKKLSQLTEETSLEDGDLLLVEASSVSKRIKWSTVYNNIKSKLVSWLNSLEFSVSTTDKTLPGAINELKTEVGKINSSIEEMDSSLTTLDGKVDNALAKANAWDAYQKRYEGQMTFLMVWGKDNSGNYCTNEVCTPLSPDTHNFALKSINVPGMGNVALDYKNLNVGARGNIWLECSAKGANGMDALINNVCAVVVQISAKTD